MLDSSTTHSSSPAATTASASAASVGSSSGDQPVATLAPTPRGFWSLMFTQFQGAFSDNALKWLCIFLILRSGMPKDAQETFVANAGLVFAVPFLLLSVWGGWLSDRVSKKHIMIGVKAAEVLIMLFATYALATHQGTLQLVAIGLMGVHSTFFAPAKYGILPEVLPVNRLSWANGILELLTFVAVILGTIVGGGLAQVFGAQQLWSGLVLVALALIGLWTAFKAPDSPVANPTAKIPWFFPAALWQQIKRLRTDRDLWRACWGNTGFFYIAALVTLNLTLAAEHVYGLSPMQASWLQAALCLGIGAGSFFAGQQSHGRIDYRFVTIGAALLAVGAFGTGWPGIAVWPFAACLVLLGFGGGLFIVPIAAVLQHRPGPEEKGAVQGVASWLSWVGIALASFTPSLLSAVLGYKVGYSGVFWFAAAATVAMGLYQALTRRDVWARAK